MLIFKEFTIEVGNAPGKHFEDVPIFFFDSLKMLLDLLILIG